MIDLNELNQRIRTADLNSILELISQSPNIPATMDYTITQIILHGQVSLLEKLCPPNQFDSIPDKIHEFVKGAILHGPIESIYYFIENNCCINDQIEELLEQRFGSNFLSN